MNNDLQDLDLNSSPCLRVLFSPKYNMSHITNKFQTLTLTDNTLTSSSSKGEMSEVESLSKFQQCNASNTTQGWTKMIAKQRKTDAKSILEKLHEPPTVPSASPRSLVQNKLGASWTIWDHQSNKEIPKDDWNSGMREVATVSAVDEFWVNWSYIPLLRYIAKETTCSACTNLCFKH